jgi:uncharacterized RDD family membrane protein YckC
MSDEVQQSLRSAGLELASLKKRSFAFFIDEFLLAFLFLIIIYDRVSGVSDPDAMVALINSFTFEYLLLKVAYQTLFVYQYGASIGKIAMKIKVVDVLTLEKPIFSSALNRAVFRVISEMLFYLGFAWAFYNQNRQSWQDKTARTIVVDA